MPICTRAGRAAAAAILATLMLSPLASAQTTVAPAIHRIAPQIHIDNFARVSDTYFRGAQPVGRDYADLAALGVRTVINLIGDDEAIAGEQAAVEQNGMRYVHIPMSTRRAPTDKEIAEFFAVVGDAANGPVYVHCVGGRHRTGVMTALYRMTKDGLTGEQAFREMKQFKYGPDFLHPEFKKFVYAYQAPKTAAAVATSVHQ